MATSIKAVELVDVGSEIGVTVIVSDDYYPHLQVRFTFDDGEGTLPLDSVSVERTEEEMKHRPEITVYELRAEFPWASWERAARMAAAEEFAVRGGRLHPIGIQSSGDSLFSSHLMQIVLEYRAHVKAGLRNPAALIAEKHGVKPATARSWIHRARELGLLGPAAGRTAGEAGVARGAGTGKGRARGSKASSKSGGGRKLPKKGTKGTKA